MGKGTVKVITYAIIIIALCVLIPYGCYQAKRSWNYSAGYESKVRDSICDMVKPASLKNPDDC